MKTYGLIGKSLKHSFSPQYFIRKWSQAGINEHQYLLFEFSGAEEILDLKTSQPGINGLNITIPYKESVKEYCDKLSETAREIGAVNCIKIRDGIWEGHNTDGPAFLESIGRWLPETWQGNVFILGYGGAAKAVEWAIKQLGFNYYVVSRKSGKFINYENLNTYITDYDNLIINTTPLGMYPNKEACPPISFDHINKSFYLYDLIYNPEKTLFLSRGESRGAHIKNGLEMLEFQAELAWQIWNT